MLPEISSKKNFLYSDVFINTINKKSFACLVTLQIKSDMIWHIQIENEKAFCHSEISMISIQNF